MSPDHCLTDICRFNALDEKGNLIVVVAERMVAIDDSKGCKWRFRTEDGRVVIPGPHGYYLIELGGIQLTTTDLNEPKD